MRYSNVISSRFLFHIKSNMNSYRIVFPYVSDRTHLVANKSQAFDACHEEINQSGRPVNVFVVLDVHTNTPYYLENLKVSSAGASASANANAPAPNAFSPNISCVDGVVSADDLSNLNEVVVKRDVRNSSDVLQTVQKQKQNPNPLSQYEQQNVTQDIRLDPYFQHLISRVDLLESELVKAKMKLEYATQAMGTNMHNLNLRAIPKEEPKEESCTIM